MYGKTVYEVWIEKYGKERADELKKLESKNKRLGAIKRLENTFGQISPNYNPIAIPIIEHKAKELSITDLQHAENGGEFYIKELGYWIDGYSKEKI